MVSLFQRPHRRPETRKEASTSEEPQNGEDALGIISAPPLKQLLLCSLPGCFFPGIEALGLDKTPVLFPCEICSLAWI